MQSDCDSESRFSRPFSISSSIPEVLRRFVPFFFDFDVDASASAFSTISRISCVLNIERHLKTDTKRSTASRRVFLEWEKPRGHYIKKDTGLQTQARTSRRPEDSFLIRNLAAKWPPPRLPSRIRWIPIRSSDRQPRRHEGNQWTYVVAR